MSNFELDRIFQHITQLGQSGHFEQVVVLCKQILQQNPQTPRAYDFLGMAALEQQDYPRAIEHFETAIRLDSGVSGFYDHAGVAYCRAGHWQAGITRYQQALALQPQSISIRYHLALALKASGNREAAITEYQRILAQAPDHLFSYLDLALLWESQGNLSAAKSHYLRVVELQPNHVDAWYHLANLHANLGESEAAIQAYQQVIQLNPQITPVYNHLGILLQSQGQISAAISCYQKALQQQSDLIYVQLNLANAFILDQQFQEAENTLRHLLESEPKHLGALDGLARLLIQTCQWQKLTEIQQALLTETRCRIAMGESCEEINPLTLLSLPFSPSEQRILTTHYAQQFLKKVPPEQRWVHQYRHRESHKLKLGYVSPDFRDHPVGYAIERLFELHDREKFIVFAYSLAPADHSSVQQKLRQDCDHWRDVSHLSPKNIAGIIAEDQIDILIDLGGYTQLTQPEIFAWKPAPLQVNYLGYPGTLGVDYMDYLITDSVITPSHLTPHFSENCLYLDAYFLTNNHQAHPSTTLSYKKLSRADAGLPETGIVYCCFNNIRKIDPQSFAVWMRILQQVPQSVLWLRTPHPEVQKNLYRVAESFGISPQRLVFAPYLSRREDHLLRHQLADVFLDTHLYNAHVTACDALWMGVPVITTPGETFASRVAASLVTAMGVPDLITPNLRAYEQLAVKLGQEPDVLTAIKVKLAQNRVQTSLFNTEQTVLNLEAAYQQIWKTWSQDNVSTSLVSVSNLSSSESLNRDSFQPKSNLNTNQYSPNQPMSNPQLDSIFQEIAKLGQSGQFNQVASLCQQILERYPNTAEAYHFLGLSALQQGQFQEALTHLEKAIQLNPNTVEFYNHAGVAYCQQGHWQQGILAYQTALNLNPNLPDTRYNLALALQKSGQLDAAILEYQSLLNQYPRYAPAYASLGHALQEKKQVQPAISCYQKAIEIQPNQAEFWYNLGVCWQSLNEIQQAREAYSQALKINPNYAEAHNSLGTLLELNRNYPGAINEYQIALQINPNLTEALMNLAGIQHRGNQVQEATKIYQTLLEKDPNNAKAIGGLLTIARQTCQWSNIEPLSVQLWQISQTEKGVYMPFSSLFSTMSASQQQQVAEEHAQSYAERVQIQRQQLQFNFENRPKSDKIRLGYISGDFRNHVMADLVIELFAQHDRNQFEIYAYGLQPDDGSYQRQKLQRDADHFRDVSTIPAIAVAQQIYADGIDILVDLAGYTDYANPEILAYKPAPLQINYLGYPGTSGAQYMDYIITDAVIGIPTVADHLTEKCFYLPHSYQLNGHRHTIATADQKVLTDNIIYPIPSVKRDRFGLPENAVVYCCFNKVDKIDPVIFGAWMRILAQVPNSVLWLLIRHPEAVPNLAATAASHGVDPKRLILTPAATKPEYLIRYQCADIFLDTLNYNAHVTASDALWMGVPVITTPGQTFASRVSASLLTALEVPELIAPSLVEYEQLAIHLGQHPEALQRIKQKLTEKRLTAPLFNAELTIRHLEAGYRQIWQRYVQGEVPASIWVESQPHPNPPLAKGRGEEVANSGLNRQDETTSISSFTPITNPPISPLNKGGLRGVPNQNGLTEAPKVMPPSLLPPKAAPPLGTQTTITFNIDEGFQNWMSQCGGSLAITTYQAGKVATVGWNGQQVTIGMQTFLRPMGIATSGNRIALATKQEVIILGNAAPLSHTYQENQLGRYDALFLPRTSYFTGDLYIHDLAFVENDIWVVNTRFSCVGKLSDEFNFVPIWKPKFISQLAPEDRCHLNGLCLVKGKAKYVTALGETDDVGGWRPHKATGGIVIDLETDEIIARGLSMPHSPCWHQDHLWVLNSGAGELWRINPQNGSYDVVCSLPGFLRGLCLVGDYAIIGLCKIREQHIFGGLPIQEKFRQLYCGVIIIDIRTGERVGLLDFPTGCEELYDIEFLANTQRPMILNLEDEVRQDAFMMPTFAYWLRASFLSKE